MSVNIRKALLHYPEDCYFVVLTETLKSGRYDKAHINVAALRESLLARRDHDAIEEARHSIRRLGGRDFPQPHD